MLANQGQAVTTTILLSPVSAAATVNATSAWIDVRSAEGDLMLIAQIGALTGSITWTTEDATDGAGTGAAGITPNEGAFAAGAANQLQKRTVNAGATRGFVRIVGTIVTGPALVASSLSAHQKYT
jgi:hypothetical protein